MKIFEDRGGKGGAIWRGSVRHGAESSVSWTLGDELVWRDCWWRIPGLFVALTFDVVDLLHLSKAFDQLLVQCWTSGGANFFSWRVSPASRIRICSTIWRSWKTCSKWFAWLAKKSEMKKASWYFSIPPMTCSEASCCSSRLTNKIVSQAYWTGAISLTWALETSAE